MADVTDSAALDQFFADLEGPIDHLYMTAGGPYYAPLSAGWPGEPGQGLGGPR